MKTRDFINTFKTTKIMKTGGTMNFLKRAGAILMVVAIFASSCNKYADDFKQLNTKLDALATQVAGVTQLTTDLAATKASVATLVSSVAALPNPTAALTKLQGDLTTALTNIGTINTTLNNLATTVATTTASKADVTAAIGTITSNVKTELSAQLLLVNNNITAAVNSIKADNSAQNTAINNEIIANNTTLAGLIQAQITAMQNALTGSGTDATAVTVKGLQLLLQAQQTALNQLLANSNFFAGNVNITSDAEVAFYLTKIGTWIGGGMISGNVTVTTTNISVSKRADLKTITDNIIAVIANGASGAGDLTITTSAGDALSFAKLASLAGSVGVTTKAAVNEVSFPVLATVGANYSVTGFDIADAALTSVTGAVSLNYDGGYVQPALAKAGAITLTDFTTSAVGVTPVVIGTLSVDLSGLTAATSLNGGTSVFSSATSVALGQVPYSSITANAANTVNLAYSASTGLAGATVNATKAGSVITLGLVKTTGANDLTVVGSATSSVSLANLTALSQNGAITAKTVAADKLASVAGTLGLTSVTPVSLPVLATSGAITANTAVSFSAPALVSSGLSVTAATDVTIASSTTANLSTTSGTLKNLTFKALAGIYGTSGTALTTVTVTGKAATANSFTFTAGATTALTTAAFDGTIVTVSLTGTDDATKDKLTSVTTAGNIDNFRLINSDIITGVTLGHDHIIANSGSSLVVTGNDALLALAPTSLDFMATLNVSNNAALATLDFSSYKHILLAGGAPSAVHITIGANKLVGTYTAPVAATLTTPFAEATLVQPGLSTLKTYVGLINTAVTAVTHSLTISVDVFDSNGAVAGTPALSAVKTSFGIPSVTTTGVISTGAEFVGIVQ